MEISIPFDNDIMAVGSNCVQLHTTTDTMAIYSFTFNVDLALALSKNAQIVRLTAYLPSAEGSRENDKQDLELATTSIDLTAYVSNDKIANGTAAPGDALGKSATGISYVPASSIHGSTNDYPVIEGSMCDDDRMRSHSKSYTQMAREMIAMGIDPASIASYSTAIDATREFLGTTLDSSVWFPRDADNIVRECYAMFTDDTPTKTLRNVLSVMDGESLVPYIVWTEERNARVIGMMKIDTNVLFSRGATFDVHIHVLDGLGVPVAMYVMTVDHGEQLEHTSTPLKPPCVSVSVDRETLRGRLDIRQMDPRASSVDVYARTINTMSYVPDPYKLIINLVANIGSGVTYPLQFVTGWPTIYRVVPHSDSGHDVSVFGSAVAIAKPLGVPRGQLVPTSFSMLARVTKGALTIELRQIPATAAFITLYRRNMTTHQKDWTRVGAIPAEMSDRYVGVEGSKAYSQYVDRDVRPGYVYQYRCDVSDRFSNIVENAQTEIVKFFDVTDGIVDTQVLNLKTDVVEGKPDCTFTLQTKIIETQKTMLYSMLDVAGLLTIFQQELKDERDLFSKLIAYGITRHNLMTGETESFGTTTDESFSDTALGVINAVKPLEPGSRYRYEIHTYLMSPETLFERYSKSMTAAIAVDGRPYSFKPSKFMHPVILSDGSISTPESRRRNHAEDEMAFGHVGNVVELEASIATSSPVVLGASAMQFGMGSIEITWKTTEATISFDHFLIVRQVLGIRSFIGAAHAIPGISDHRYVHAMTPADRGTVEYSIIPVYENFSLGPEISAGQIVSD